MSDDVLSVRDLHAWYGESHVLHGVDFNVRKGEVVTLLGRNGAGRTSTLKSILGRRRTAHGSIVVNGVETIALPTYKIAHLGIGYCPEERGIFSSLSVEENLILPPKVGEGGMSVDEIYEMFPNLRERRKTAQGTRPFGWRAADARHGAHPSHRGAPAAARRNHRRFGAGHCPGARPRHHEAQGSRLHDRAGGAEFPVRGAARGPALRDGAWKDRGVVRGFRAGFEDGNAS
jgi:ABC-type Fe3+/spermidine/putrescine transport system ATPase subunit